MLLRSPKAVLACSLVFSSVNYLTTQLLIHSFTLVFTQEMLCMQLRTLLRFFTTASARGIASAGCLWHQELFQNSFDYAKFSWNLAAAACRTAAVSWLFRFSLQVSSYRNEGTARAQCCPLSCAAGGVSTIEPRPSLAVRILPWTTRKDPYKLFYNGDILFVSSLDFAWWEQ